MRSLAVEGTVFWLTVSAVIELATVAATSQHLIEGLLVAVLSLVIAFFCWNLKNWAFLVSAVLSLFIAVSAFPLLFGGEETPLGALIDALVILAALATFFFGYRAYRELKATQAVL